MKKISILLLFVFSTFYVRSQALEFDRFFLDKTLRIDYTLLVEHDQTLAAIEQLKEEGKWAGTKTNLISPFENGQYRVELYDSLSGRLIYTYGYSSLSSEWRAMEVSKNNPRAFYESVLVPFPINTVKFVLYYRKKNLALVKVLERWINPNDYHIINEQRFKFKTTDLIINGPASKKVDLVFVAEGYTEEEMPLFRQDVEHFVKVLFSHKPFDKHKSDFNIRYIESTSEQSGADIPARDVWKNTILNSAFYTFDIERYITTFDIKTLRDIAAEVPYDQIFVLVNTNKYGGSGFYNFYNIGVARNASADEVLVHEFGHGFAGLADEYWTAGIDEGFYDKSVEPLEPNITTLVNFDRKWKSMVSDTVPVPTPSTEKYKNVIGVFEGGGYSEKGIYRPKQNCLMRALGYDFCEVCSDAIEKVIDYYTK